MEDESRLLRCFAAVFPDLNEYGLCEASVESVTAWDSLATVTIIELVTEEFGIEIDVDDVERLASFEEFLLYVRGKTVVVQ